MVVSAQVLSSIGIQGFKAVFDSVLNIGPFTLIIGRNGSGKSSAIEAIQWLRDAIFLGVDAATPREVAFKDLVNRRADQLTLDVRFFGKGLPVHYTLGVKSSWNGVAPIVVYEHCVVGRTTGARTIVRSRKGKRGPAYRWVGATPSKLSVTDSNELGLRFTKTSGISGGSDLVDFLARAVFLRLSPKAISSPSRSEPRGWRPLLADDGYDLAILLSRLTTRQRKGVIARLRKIFPGVEGLDVDMRGPERRFTVTERMRSRGGTRPFPIPSSLLSEGMRRLVAVFALLESEPSPSLLVIEEIENGLDPWTLEAVLDALREVSNDTQVVLTTHSPFFLDHVSVHEVVHVRREKGDTQYERVSDISEAAKYETVLPPGAMYLAKVLGDQDPEI